MQLHAILLVVLTMRTFAIGDIHGEDEKLKSLIEKLPLFEGDKLVS